MGWKSLRPDGVYLLGTETRQEVFQSSNVQEQRCDGHIRMMGMDGYRNNLF